MPHHMPRCNIVLREHKHLRRRTGRNGRKWWTLYATCPPPPSSLGPPPLAQSPSLPSRSVTERMPVLYWQKRYGLSRHGGPINERGPFRHVQARLTQSRRRIPATFWDTTDNNRCTEKVGVGEEIQGEIHFGSLLIQRSRHFVDSSCFF